MAIDTTNDDNATTPEEASAADTAESVQEEAPVEAESREEAPAASAPQEESVVAASREAPLATLYSEFVSIGGELGDFELSREEYSFSTQRAKTQRLLRFEEALTLEGQIEALVFAAPKPLRAAEILEMIQTDDNAHSEEHVEEVLQNLLRFYEERGSGFKLEYIKGAYQFQTVPAAALLMERLFASRPRPLSRAALETLSIIAYRQPVTRAEIEYIRGVDAGSIIKNLIERNLITCVGRKEDAGRPMLFGTTSDFLEVFRLNSLNDLPPLSAFQPSPEVMSEARQKLESGETEVDVEEFIGDDEEHTLSDEQRTFLGEVGDDEEGLEGAVEPGTHISTPPPPPSVVGWGDVTEDEDDDEEEEDEDDDSDNGGYDADSEAQSEDDDEAVEENSLTDETMVDKENDPFWELSLLEKKKKIGHAEQKESKERQGASAGDQTDAGEDDGDVDTDGSGEDSEVDLTTRDRVKKRGRKVDRGETDLS